MRIYIYLSVTLLRMRLYNRLYALTECSADEPAKNRSQRSRRVDLGRQRVHQARTQEQRERTRRLDSHYYYIPTYDNCARHLRIYVYLVALYLGVFDWKVQRFCWPKGTSLECAELIYVKTTGAACVSEELCR